MVTFRYILNRGLDWGYTNRGLYLGLWTQVKTETINDRPTDTLCRFIDKEQKKQVFYPDYGIKQQYSNNVPNLLNYKSFTNFLTDRVPLVTFLQTVYLILFNSYVPVRF